ncbi:MAG: PAS domain-containing protein [Thalassobaculaceae bacterium]|uniref:PAS domain-containing protein n=1 Tax=Roseitalea porphyridii TaxID=1852022 RepID=UPI0032EE948A
MSTHPSLVGAEDFLKRAQSDAVRDVLAYWISIHPGDRLPARADFDPLDIPKSLPSLVLTDVERNPYRFRVRLMGMGVVDAIGRDFTGSYLDEVWPNAEDQLLIRHRIEVVETGLPSYRYGRSPTQFRLDFAALERVFIPFAASGRDVDVILSAVTYLQPPSE